MRILEICARSICCLLCILECVLRVKAVNSDSGFSAEKATELRCNMSKIENCSYNTTKCLQIHQDNHNYFNNNNRLAKVPKSTTCVIFEQSWINILPQGFFIRLTSLEFIDLSYSNITKIGDSTFSISSLVHVTLRGNKLRSLSAGVFVGADSLESIDLSYNSLKFFSPETFTNLPSLRDLHLSHNGLNNETFGPGAVDWANHIPELKYLDLAFNNIVFADSMPFQMFSGLEKLEVLILRGNWIPIDYGVFARNRFLRILDLSYNKITYFDINFLLSMNSLETLLVHGNAISYSNQIELSGIHTIFPNFHSLGISDNAFSCEVLSEIVKRMLSEKITLEVEDDKFVSNKRNIRGVACV